MKETADQKNLLSKARLYISKNNLISPGDLVIAALSGGPDSVALTEVLLVLQEKFKFTLEACHFNHKLRGKEGDGDQKFVEKYCQRHGIHLTVGERGPGETINSEDDARELRYKFFKQVLADRGRGEGKIATAHHQDDLAETYLMRLIRGSGLKGLSSILPQRKNYIRPLLSISKSEILDYLEMRDEPYRIDSSNLSDRYFRNQIRNQLLPILSQYNHQIAKKLAETAEMTAEAYKYIETCVGATFQRVVDIVPGGYSIDVVGFSQLQPVEKNFLVIMCIDKLAGRDYTFAQVRKIVQLIDQNVGRKSLPLPHSLRFELKNGKIYLYNKQSVNNKENDGKSKKK